MNEQSQKPGMESFNWSGFHHVALVTSDLDGTINFYEKLLGMQVTLHYPATSQRGRHCFVKPGNTESWGIHFFEYPDAQIFHSEDSLRRLSENPEASDLYRFLPGGLQHIAFALTSDGYTI